MLSVADYERLAEERLDAGPWAYLSGGSGDEWTLRENRAAFARWTFRPRVLRDVSEISTTRTVLGSRVELPVVVAPVAYQQLYHPDGECATARGAAAAGAGMAVSTFSTATHEELAAAATLDSLPEVVDAIAGRVEVYLDGGIRRGTDVAKALALGARCVLAGRAPVFGLAVAGEDGVKHVLELLRDELALALCLLGCTSPGELTRAHVQRAAV